MCHRRHPRPWEAYPKIHLDCLLYDSPDMALGGEVFYHPINPKIGWFVANLSLYSMDDSFKARSSTVPNLDLELRDLPKKCDLAE